ncbi:F0F1 ATP synthase subunit B [Periweissella beninensis]|uniref:ATP synthase subunit b n=1 Tax=Periweissella beninensis TaxID=504936 RepID=A0ABT0VJQ4_9LACO|nr:F0F1 ATP synthase subunit B [Periweissella beninensis]MBM7543666.1 F-type H+-transporting ATPase subunit b [Periweissella beninensis]MCM2436645.1 F0F1 ATP synthase subunit B [Periweissella beninensis]MCT4395615.1 ATP synthase F0 subunit B [Periweissella beninensis]
MFSVDVLTTAEGLNSGDMFFIIVSFIVLLLLVKKFAWGPVTKMMADRADKIADDIDAAENARDDAEKLATERRQQLQASRQEATTIVADAKTQGNKQRETIVANAQNDVVAMKKTAGAEIEQERRDALDGVKNDVAALSVEIATKIIQKELKLEDQKALIDSYIEGLGTKHEA